MRVIFQKADLDTCLTAMICGVGPVDTVEVVAGQARAVDLEDPLVLCIEAGGTGQTQSNNFDHHDPQHYYPPACRQAAGHHGVTDIHLLRIVEYVCRVDEACRIVPPIAYPSLSNLFSGIRAMLADPLSQFRHGADLLRKVWDRRLDPFQPMPANSSWQPYLQRQQANRATLEKDMALAFLFTTGKGRLGGFVQSNAPGALGALYARGCHIAVAQNSASRKFTIGSTGAPVAELLPLRNGWESGWGGRETIIGSPGNGTRLNAAALIELIKEIL
jgi:hypothetical protein